MGYSVELFIEQDVNQEFMCSVCQDVLRDPTMLEPCEHAFCRTCINEWRTRSDTCPIDRQPIAVLKKPPRIYMNLLNGLQMYCPFRESGCHCTMKLGDLPQHDERCQFNPDNQRQCVGGCGAILSKAQARIHSCVEYLKEQLSHTKDDLKLKEDELMLTKDKVKKYKQRLRHFVTTAVEVAATSPASRGHTLRNKPCPARFKAAPSTMATLPLEPAADSSRPAPGWRSRYETYLQSTRRQSGEHNLVSTQTISSGGTGTDGRAGPYLARFKNTMPYPAYPAPPPAHASSSGSVPAIMLSISRTADGRLVAAADTTTVTRPVTPPPVTSTTGRRTSLRTAPCPARFKK